MPNRSGRLPNFPGFPPIAKDWLTGEESPNVVFKEGKWWTKYHWEHWRRDRVKDQRRLERNRAIRNYLKTQAVDASL